MPEENYKHWAIEEKDNGIVCLGMDVEDSSTNVLSATVLAEFYQILTKLTKKPSCWHYYHFQQRQRLHRGCRC